MFQILVAEEDYEIRQMLIATLQKHNYKAIGVSNGAEALQTIEREPINLIVCNVMLPQLDGYALTRLLKERNCDIPVIMLMSEEISKIERMKLLEEAQDLLDNNDNETILIRLQQMLMHKKSYERQQVAFGDVAVDLGKMTVQIGEDKTTLSKEEFLLLAKFIFFPNKIYTRLQLAEAILGKNVLKDNGLIDGYISQIKKIIANSKEVEIKLVPGLGYKAIKKVVP